MIHNLITINSDDWQRLTRTAAQIIAILIIMALQPASADGDTPANDPLMPLLGNTAETDRELIREVRDGQVYNPEPPSVVLAEPDAQQPELNTAGAVQDEKETVWDLLRAGDKMNLRHTDAVDAQKDQYLKDAIWVQKLLKRSTPYLQFIVSQLQERHLPVDLALLPAVESGFQPSVKSQNGAAGLWQIVPVTAREIGLNSNAWSDPRKDLIASTRAALDYLSYLNAEFNGEWELTLAAYNAGPGRVRAAMRKNRKRGLPTNFESLRLPAETRAYVPKVAALIELVVESPESRLSLPIIPNIRPFTEVDIGQRISFDKAALLAEERQSTIARLNAGLVHGVTAPKGPHKLLLPAHSVPTFRSNLAKAEGQQLYSLPGTHRVRSGDTLSSIALFYGITQRQLRDLNALDRDKILIGQKLIILDNRLKKTVASAPAKSVNGARPAIHVVKPGDAISTIAQQYRLSEKKLRALNDLQGNKILIGQRLAILDNTPDPSLTTIDYVIQPGDTLSEIAVRFRVRMADISFSSGDSAVDRLLIPGKTLRIKSGT